MKKKKRTNNNQVPNKRARTPSCFSKLLSVLIYSLFSLQTVLFLSIIKLLARFPSFSQGPLLSCLFLLPYLTSHLVSITLHSLFCFSSFVRYIFVLCDSLLTFLLLLVVVPLSFLPLEILSLSLSFCHLFCSLSCVHLCVCVCVCIL